MFNGEIFNRKVSRSPGNRIKSDSHSGISWSCVGSRITFATRFKTGSEQEISSRDRHDLYPGPAILYLLVLYWPASRQPE